MARQSKTGKNSGIEHQASQTAMFAAIHRHVATMEVNPHLRGPDHLARFFLPPRAVFFLRFRFIHRKIRRRVPGVYEYVTARTRYFDDLFKQALVENIPQIVLLGAGYDTRAMRFKDSIQRTDIFELDAPTAQRQKRIYTEKHHLPVPEHLTFVPINFSHEELGEALFRAGYDKSERTFFLWEGVTFYLDQETVRQTLAFIKDNSGPGSTVGFDYFYKSVARGGSDSYGAKQAYESAANQGEPFRFGIEEGKHQQFLAESGFEVLSHHTSDELADKYLKDDKGESMGKIIGFGCQVLAGAKPLSAGQAG